METEITTPADASHAPAVRQIQDHVGQAARARQEILDAKMTSLEVRGEIKPTTLLNMSPFELSLCSGLIPMKIPQCPADKPYYEYTFKTCVSEPRYRQTKELQDGSLRRIHDVDIYLPVQQAMEFKHFYVGEEVGDPYKQGGVIIFEWDSFEDYQTGRIHPDYHVRVPYWMIKKRNRYIMYEKRKLRDLMKEQEEQMYTRAMAAINQANLWYDDQAQRKNIQAVERIWHDFALRKQWIETAQPWRTATYTTTTERCPRCTQPYTSRTGICKCTYVYDPFTAYMAGEITIDHVRMSILTAEQWKKVRAEETKRKDARGE